MNLVLLDDKDFIASDRVEIHGERFLHVKKVIRAQKGDTLSCGQINGKMGTGTVLSMDRQGLVMDVCLSQDPPAPIPLTLVLALPRPKMLKRILQSISSLGVKEIFLINSWRVEKSFWASDLLEKDRLERHLRLGLSQAKDTMMPNIYLKRYFTAFVKEELPDIAKDKKRILAHPKTSQPCPSGVNKETVLVIGPEGGFIDLEVDTLAESGFEPFSMGPRILRVETAVTALISRLFT
ncbi:MAG: 16S rRNA (uracil(1498)-N(3))-methyltransferase [Desulfobacterales bacterium]|nr:16S rRNA (uracil(1498)-N(3))-methyltransferase [Desulfobacterales bacterium]